MELKDILSHVDHTLLAVDATWEQIRAILEDAIFYRCASACIPASYVHRAADYVEGSVAVCTVIVCWITVLYKTESKESIHTDELVFAAF